MQTSGILEVPEQCAGHMEKVSGRTDAVIIREEVSFPEESCWS